LILYSLGICVVSKIEKEMHGYVLILWPDAHN